MQQSPSVSFPSRRRRCSARWQVGARLGGVAVVSTAHALAIAALAAYAPAREALLEADPIVVNLVAPPRVEVAPPKPAAELPKPKPVVKPKPIANAKPVPPASIIAAPAQEPSSFVALPAPAALAASTAAAPQPKGDPGPPPPRLIPPRFDADYLHNPPPPYPPLARRMGEQGRVVLRVLVSADGHAERVELRTSSGSPRLDESALATVRRWTFVPARQGDQPVPAWVLVPISFTLEG